MVESLRGTSAWSTPRVGYPSHPSDGETILYILSYPVRRVALQEVFFLRSIHCVPRQLLILFADDILYVRTTVRIAIRPSDVHRRPSNKSIMQPPPPPPHNPDPSTHTTAALTPNFLPWVKCYTLITLPLHGAQIDTSARTGSLISFQS